MVRDDFPPSPNHLRGVGAHPHKGFETVTITYKGRLAQHDSAIVNDWQAPEHSFVLFANQGEEITITTPQSFIVLLMLSS